MGKRLRVALVTGCVVCGSAVAWSFRPSDRLLDEVATRLCQSEVRTGTSVTFRSLWLSDHEVLEKKIGPPGPKLTSIGRYDVRTGSCAPMPALLSRINGIGSNVLPYRLSGDGKWLACGAFNLKGSGSLTYYGISMTNGTVIPWESSEPLHKGWHPRCCWLGNRFAVLQPNSVALFTAESAAPQRRLSLPLAAYDDILGSVGDDLILLSQHSATQPVTLAQVGTASESPAVHDVTIAPPPGGEVRHITLSPDGNRLAWLLHFDGRPKTAWQRFANRLFRRKPHDIDAIWVSERDGSGFHEIGRVNDGDLPFVWWGPGGHRLTFGRKRQLYFVAVDRGFENP